MDKTALIAGGGIGGLTAALALQRAGWSVHVLEQAEALAEVGAGLQLSPNATKVLFALGLEEPVRSAAFEPEALELRLGKSGRGVFSIEAGRAAKDRWGAPYLHIHRADLISILARAIQDCPDIKVQLGATVTAYENIGGIPVIHTEAGDPLTISLVVGADGIHSAIRRQMIGPDHPRFTGNIAWRMTVPVEKLNNPPPPTACVWAGKHRHAVTYLLRGGQLANFVGVVEHRDSPGESWVEQGSKTEALADFAGWHLTITELINKADAHYRWALHDREPLPSWQDSAVTLLGDAAHPMLPFQAQGAAMAIEDAWVLAACLAGEETVDQAIAAYQAKRLPRTSRMQAASRSNAGVFHRASPMSQLATFGPMWLAGQAAPSFVRSRLDWIYGHDVTAMDR